jgi:hypothetical protein
VRHRLVQAIITAYESFNGDGSSPAGGSKPSE